MKPQWWPLATLAMILAGLWPVLSLPSLPSSDPIATRETGLVVANTPKLTPTKIVSLSAASSGIIEAPDVNPVLILTAFAGVGLISYAVCDALGGVTVDCVRYVFTAIALAFLGNFLFDKRDLGSISYINDIYMPSAACRSHCTLKAAIPAGQPPVHFANITTENGILHEMYFSHDATSGIARLEAHQMGHANGTLSRRQEADGNDDEGGLVGSFDYSDENEGVWDEFQGDYSFFGNAVANELEDANSLVGCAVLWDSSADVSGGAGVASVGWNNAVYDFNNVGGLTPYYETCAGVT